MSGAPRSRPSGGLLGLARAMLLGAVRRAQQGDELEIEWLLVVAPDFLDVLELGIDLDCWETWVKAGCPKKMGAVLPTDSERQNPGNSEKSANA